MIAAASHRTKIFFALDPDDWHGHRSESLWAEPVHGAGLEPGFQLLNSPFYVRGVSFLDIVRATPASDGGLDFSGVIKRSGHSTYMLLVPLECPAFDNAWRRLEHLGCTYESGTIRVWLGPRTLYSVDVPETTDIYAVHRIMVEGEKRDIWVCQIGHMGHRLGSPED